MFNVKKISAILCLSLAVCSFEGFGVKAQELDPNVIETPLEGNITATVEKNDEEVVRLPYGTKSGIKDVNKCQYNFYQPLTTYANGTCTLTYETSKSFEVSASTSLSCGVDIDIVTAEVGVEVGVSTTLTASEAVQYEIPKGYKGRIVLRYYQDKYTFTCYQKKNNKITKSKAGYAWTKAYGQYYARQLLAI